MSVTTKLEVEYSQFKKGLAEATASVAMLDAELKKNEAEFKATGDAEKYMADKTQLLNQKLQAQQNAAKQAEQMFLNLAKRGVSPTSVEYQRMATKMLNAQAAMSTTQAELNALNSKQQTAAGSANELATNVEKIGRNVNLQTLTDGLGKITDGMEKAYRVAVRFGRAVVRSAMDATGWADDVMTRAIEYGVDAETVQRMDQVAAYIDTDVDTIIAAKDKLSKNRDKVSELLGLSTDGRTVDDVLWEAGEAIMNLGDGFDKNDYAMQIFGRGWRELLPLFEAGREQYEGLIESQNVLSNEQVQKLQEADDAFQSIQQEVNNLKREFWADNAGTIIEMLNWVVDNKDAVVAALTAIAGAFAALKTAETAANIVKIVNGLKGLTGDSAAAAAANAASAAAKTATNTAAAAAGGTTLMAGGSTATWVSNFLTSSAGIATVATIMATPIIAKAASGELFKDPWEGVGQKTKDFLTQPVAIGSGSGKGKDLLSILFGIGGGEPAEVPVEPVAEEGSAEKIAGEIGTVTVPATLDWRPSYMTGYAQQTPGWGGHANGLPFVPHDGYLAILHRGERVMTARENKSYTFNNNTYFGGVNLHNGMEVDALTDSIARQQARQAAAYGS